MFTYRLHLSPVRCKKDGAHLSQVRCVLQTALRLTEVRDYRADGFAQRTKFFVLCLGNRVILTGSFQMHEEDLRQEAGR